MSGKTSGKRRENVGRTSGKRRENVGETSGECRENVGKTSGKILELIKANPEITIPEIAFIIGISDRSIERNLQKLQEQNILKRIGANKGGHWEIMAV